MVALLINMYGSTRTTVPDDILSLIDESEATQFLEQCEPVSKKLPVYYYMGVRFNHLPSKGDKKNVKREMRKQQRKEW